MSIAINSVPARPSTDGSAPAPAGANNGSSCLPFEAILEGQAGANEGTGDVGGAGVPVDLLQTGIPAAQTAVDSLVAVLTASAQRTRPPIGKDETSQGAVISAAMKDKNAGNAAALLMLASPDVLKPSQLVQAIAASDAHDTTPANPPSRSANADELVQHLFAALTEFDARAVLNADDDDAPLTTSAPTPLIDVLNSASEKNLEPEQLRVPDLPFSRSATIPTAPPNALVDAIRLVAAQGTPPDQDKGFNQSSASAGFDRRGSKTAIAPAIHVTEAVGSFDAAVKGSVPPAAAAALSNEEAVVSSIVQSMRLQMREGVGTAVVRLEPDYLGAVSISLRVENGVVTASLHAENPQVRAWMEANAPLLRESLAGQGLSLDRLLVTDERIGDEPSGRRQQQEQEQEARHRPRRDEATTFEVVV